MKIVILYATKSGAARECAVLLSKKFGDCPVHDLSRPVPDLSGFDTIILGTGVRMGAIYKPARCFLRQNIRLLLTKKFAVYFCNAYPDTFQKAVKKNVPGELIEHAVCIMSFGGQPPFTKAPVREWLHMSEFNQFTDYVKIHGCSPIK